MVRKIIIHSKKHGQHTVLVDERDYDRVSKHRWSIGRRGKYLYAFCNYRRDGLTCLYLHRYILNIYSPKHRHIHIDHKNSNTLDNRRDNLRRSRQHTNLMNRDRNKNNTTGFKGVSKTYNGKYRTVIMFKRKWIYGGVFPTPQLAAKRYNDLATQYFGEFAKLNTLS